MKYTIILLIVLLTSFHSKGQIISTGPDQKSGYVIWYATLSIVNGQLGAPVHNYQAKVQKDVNGNKYLQVCNSDNWLKGITASPISLALYENPGSAVTVVLDYKNGIFKFYPYNTTDYSVAPHHTSSTLNFLGNDSKPYSITFTKFAGVN